MNESAVGVDASATFSPLHLSRCHMRERLPKIIVYSVDMNFTSVWRVYKGKQSERNGSGNTFRRCSTRMHICVANHNILAAGMENASMEDDVDERDINELHIVECHVRWRQRAYASVFGLAGIMFISCLFEGIPRIVAVWSGRGIVSSVGLRRGVNLCTMTFTSNCWESFLVQIIHT